jgi:hypothetical protein
VAPLLEYLGSEVVFQVGEAEEHEQGISNRGARGEEDTP